MEFMKVPIASLVPAIYNPRRDLQAGDAEYEKIRRSIEEFGYVEPIVVNKDMTIVGGHQRVKVLEALGYRDIDCVVVDVDKTKEKALNVALNKITGSWDEDKLAKVLDELKLEEYDVELTGFEWKEAEALWDQYMKAQDGEGEDEVPLVPEEPVIRPGDLILLGKHRLLCGDATRREDMSRLMNGRTARLIVTDPPYGVSYVGKTEDALTIQNDDMGDEDFYRFLLEAFTRLYELSGDGASIYVFHADTRGLIFRRAFGDSGFKQSQCCVWAKNAFVMGRHPYQWQHEPVLFGWNPTGPHYWNGDRKQGTVWNFDRPVANDVHPTMKPVALIEYLIKNSSRYGDLVVDTFLGSGTAIIASDKAGRICYGSELDPKYCQVAVERWISFKDGTSPEDVTVERNGRQYKYPELNAITE